MNKTKKKNYIDFFKKILIKNFGLKTPITIKLHVILSNLI